MSSKNYRVAPGDSLWSIAKAHGITLGELLTANPKLTKSHGRDPDLIFPGEHIIIPDSKFSEQADIDQTVVPCSILPEDKTKKEDEEEKRFFIAVADRSVKGFLGAVNHYSIQYWRCDEEVSSKGEMSVVDLSGKYSNATKIESVELLRNTGWEVWIYKAPTFSFSAEPTWQVDDISVSVIHFSDSSENLLVLKQGSESEVKPIWDKLKKSAANYEFAEQGGENFNGNFVHWPNSKYQIPIIDSPANNSNTFARFVIGWAGLKMIELDGSHPGDDIPTNVPDIYGEAPWRAGEDPPPMPINPP